MPEVRIDMQVELNQNIKQIIVCWNAYYNGTSKLLGDSLANCSVGVWGAGEFKPVKD